MSRSVAQDVAPRPAASLRQPTLRPAPFSLQNGSLTLNSATLTLLYSYILPMDPVRELGRALLILGIVIAITGALLYFGNRLPFRLGRLPGDIVHRGEHTTFYFPMVTCLVLSLVLSFLFWLFSNFRR